MDGNHIYKTSFFEHANNMISSQTLTKPLTLSLQLNLPPVAGLRRTINDDCEQIGFIKAAKFE